MIIQPQGLYQKLKPYFPFLYFCLLTIILFSGNTVSLWDQDEAAYAGFARNMIESGNWIIPEFTWSEVHRKPPLHFWNIALSYKLFGENEFAVRFPSALFTLLTYLVVFFAIRKIADTRLALQTVIVISTTLLVPTLAKVSVTDSTLLFFTTVCAFALYFILEKKSWLWVFIFWVSFALALLTKGPPVIIFSIIFITLLAILHPARKNLIMLHPWIFLPLALLPFSAWAYSTIKYDDGNFLNWMLDWYVLKRINSSVFGQTGFPGMHLLMIILFFLPWIIFLPKSFKDIWISIRKDKSVGLFFAAWFFAAWFFYEFSPSKLPSYVVAAHIPLAFFIAGNLNTALLNRKKFVPVIIVLNISLQIIGWIVLLPVVEPFRNTSKKVSEYVRTNADKNITVLIGNDRYSPPSLPFYLGADNKNVVVQTDLAELISNFYKNESSAFILSKKQAELFKKLIPENKFHAVTSPPFAQSLMNDYYLFIKPITNEIDSASSELVSNTYIEKPLTIEVYETNIRNSKDWLNGLKEHAAKEKMGLDEMIKLEATWIRDKLTVKYACRIQMLHSKKWRSGIEKRAKLNKKSFAEQCETDADFIFENRFVR